MSSELTTGDDFLSESLQYLKGVGPRRVIALADAGIHTMLDLLQHYPRRYLDRSSVTRIRDIKADSETVTIVGTIRVAGASPGRGRQRKFELIVQDESGHIKCVWFRGAAWIGKMFNTGDRVAFHGKAQSYRGQLNFTHPDFDRLDEEGPALDTGRIIALYPGTAGLVKAGLSSRAFRRIIHGLIKEHGLRMRDAMPESMREEFGLIDGRVALRAIHFPKSQAELEAARLRLKFEELFYIQLMLARVRRKNTSRPGPRLGPRGTLSRRFESDVLPFLLTGDQSNAVREILADTSTGLQMNRLLQGDVGSGKTVVAVIALLHGIDHGYQGVFMAPTEILAEQHYSNLVSYLEPLGLQVRLLVGGQKKAHRRELLQELATGEVHVAVGTHALIEDAVEFKNLGLAVVDEQHRFGVLQRARLLNKGEAVHTLLMTATPIPRSLAMTVYGDLNVTVIREKPAGRIPVQTLLRYEKSRAEVYDQVRDHVRLGQQAYIIYPLVEESEKLDLKDAESGFAALKEEFKACTLDLVHGRMSGSEKDDVMTRFKEGTTDILVSTTVIEVGVDVPNATVMLIEHAERFGLSQLHQLRGRIGRGTDQSTCILMADYKRSEEARERLDIMVGTDDGFEISEADLKMRGAGDFFGTRQSGLPDLKIADLAHDQEIIAMARTAASRLVDQDPELEGAENEPLGAHYRRFYEEKGVGMARVG